MQALVVLATADQEAAHTLDLADPLMPDLGVRATEVLEAQCTTAQEATRTLGQAVTAIEDQAVRHMMGQVEKRTQVPVALATTDQAVPATLVQAEAAQDVLTSANEFLISRLLNERASVQN
jgi:hypothetical protein